METPKPPKEDQAPAYMTMYASLWCIMLAFFVTLLSMGQQRTEEFKEGLGQIQNAFGREGGFGLLQFMRGHRMTRPGANLDSRREDTADPQDRAELIGFFKNMLWREGLSSVAILDVKVDSGGANVILQTPIEFQADYANLSMEDRKFLNKIGAIFYNRSDLSIRVDCYTRPSEDDSNDMILALERASAVTRYLAGECRISENRLSSLGYGSTRFMLYLPETNIQQTVVFSVRKARQNG
jgi:chemotaxis protein MotB